MNMGEDEVDRLLRLIAERRQELVERIAQGGVSAENTQGGYREISGRILGLDTANELVREVFRGWLPDPPRPKEAPKISDY